MTVNQITDLNMSHFSQLRRQRTASHLNLKISWPLESGRETPMASPTDTTASTSRPGSLRHRASEERPFASDSSWFSENISTPDLSESSTRRESESTLSSCCTDKSVCLEQSVLSPDKPPSQEVLDLAGEAELYDGNGQKRKFKSLYQGSDAIGEQQLIIFVRHFFCSACQGYLKAIHQAISMKQYFSLPIPTSITIIGLGDPKLIPAYRNFTGTKFPIFTDPSRNLHRLLGMSWSLKMGRRPEYAALGVRKGQTEVSRQTALLPDEQKAVKSKGGSFWWVGGEFLIKEGRVVWCHRMKNYRDHVEIEVLKDLLGVDSAIS